MRREAPASPFVQPYFVMAEADPLAALRSVAALRGILDDVEEIAVGAARARGVTWRQMAPALGLNYRSAHRRYRHVDAS